VWVVSFHSACLLCWWYMPAVRTQSEPCITANCRRAQPSGAREVGRGEGKQVGGVPVGKGVCLFNMPICLLSFSSSLMCRLHCK